MSLKNAKLFTVMKLIVHVEADSSLQRLGWFHHAKGSNAELVRAGASDSSVSPILCRWFNRPAGRHIRAGGS